MRDPFYESSSWLDVRYRALKRENGYCQCCGSRGTPDNPIQVDHIKPRSRFPHLQLALSNLQVLCRHCNLGKSNSDWTDWRHAPSRDLEILATLESAKRFRLQQLGWLKLNGESGQVRLRAHREYRALWREIETQWIKDSRARREPTEPVNA
jgi:hypothetical protein